MKTYFNWFEYNSKRNKEAIKIYNYNLRSKFNYIEKGVYKNVRDIYALSLLLATKINSTSYVLDYGGNLLPQSNLSITSAILSQSEYKISILFPSTSISR